MQSTSKIITHLFSALYLSTAFLAVDGISHDGHTSAEEAKKNPFSKKSGMYKVHELTNVLTSSQSKREKDLAANNIIALLASGGKVKFSSETDNDEEYDVGNYSLFPRLYENDQEFFGIRDKTKGRSDIEWQEVLRALTYANEYLSSTQKANKIFAVWNMLYSADEMEARQNQKIKNHVRSIYFLYYLAGTVREDNKPSFLRAQQMLHDEASENGLENVGLHFSDNDMHGKQKLLTYNNTDFETFIKQCQKEYSEEQEVIKREKPRMRNVGIGRHVKHVDDHALDSDIKVDNNLKENLLPLLPDEKFEDDFSGDSKPDTAPKLDSKAEDADTFDLDEEVSHYEGIPLAIRLPDESVPEKVREKPKFAALTKSKEILKTVNLDYREKAIKQLIDDGTFSDKTLKNYIEPHYFSNEMQLIPVEKWELLDAYCRALYNEQLISPRELERQKALAHLSKGKRSFYESDRQLKTLIEQENISPGDREKLEKAFTDFNTPSQYTNLALKIDDEKFKVFNAYYKALHGGEELLPRHKRAMRNARNGFAKEFTYIPEDVKKVLNLMDQPVVDKGALQDIQKAFTETKIGFNDTFVNTIDDHALKALMAYFEIVHPKSGDIASEEVLRLRQAASTLGKVLGERITETPKRLIGLIKKEKLEQDDLSYIDNAVRAYSISGYDHTLSMTIKDAYLYALDDYSRALRKRNLVNGEQREARNAIQMLSEKIKKFYAYEQNLLKAVETLDRENIDRILTKTSRGMWDEKDQLILSMDDSKLGAFQEFFEFKYPDQQFVSPQVQRVRDSVTQLSGALKKSYSETLEKFHGLIDKKIKGQMNGEDTKSFESNLLNYFAFNDDKKLRLTISNDQLKAFENYYKELTGSELLSPDQQRKRNALEKLNDGLNSNYSNYDETLRIIRTPKDINDRFMTDTLSFKTDSDKALAQYFVDLYDEKEDEDGKEWSAWVEYVKENLQQ